MVRYPVLIDGEPGAYGVVFPDLPGAGAMGNTVDDALRNAADMLRDFVEIITGKGAVLPDPTPCDSIQVPPGNVLATVPLIRRSGRHRRLSLTLDEDVAHLIDQEAKRRGMTRKSFITWMALETVDMTGGA